MPKDLIIRELENSDAQALSILLSSQPIGYLEFFTPFSFEQATISSLLSARRKDAWLGISWDGALIGFFMLRGWDEGFEVPAYGGMIDRKFGGWGFGRLSLKIAKSIALFRCSPRIMLKVNRRNVGARKLFAEAGFKFTRSDLEHGDLIYHYELPRRPARV